MKMLKSCGDVILPCATPVFRLDPNDEESATIIFNDDEKQSSSLEVIVALSSSFVASLTVAPSYIYSNKSTSRILNILITCHNAA